MRVPVRPVAARMVGRWFLEQFKDHPNLRSELPTDQVDFLCSLAVRTGTYVEKGRPFFERFVLRWGAAIARWDINLCWQFRPAQGVLDTPEAALAELVEDMRTALASRVLKISASPSVFQPPGKNCAGEESKPIRLDDDSDRLSRRWRKGN